MPALRKVAEITLAGKTFHLARNGTFCLVEDVGPDAYENPVARVVSLEEFVCAANNASFAITKIGEARIQALIDLVGELTTRLQGRLDLQAAAGGRDANANR